MSDKKTRRIGADRHTTRAPRWTEAVIPAYADGRRIEMLRVCASGDVFYYGRLIGNDEDVAAALIDIVNSHEQSLGGPSEQAACWAITELMRRKNAS